jgi:hypothetical protein
MRKQMKDLKVKTSYFTENQPIKIWGESGPEWGGKLVATHHFYPGMDLTPFLHGFPDGLCPIPHWGYVFKGKMYGRYKDGTVEVYQEGDVFYMPPGHTLWTDKNAEEACEIIQFSEGGEFKEGEELVAETNK